MALSQDGDSLYHSLLQAAKSSPDGLKKVFFQEDLENFTMKSAKTLQDLMSLVTELQRHMLLRTSKLGGRLCWSTRPRDAARAIKALTNEERIVYEYVEASHEAGIWIKEIKRKSNINGIVVDKAMKTLEKNRLVKGVKNVKQPVQKTYMLFHLVPSEDVTGGSFFDGGMLDQSLVEELSNLIVFHVRMVSWAETKSRKVKREVDRGESPELERKTKRARTIATDIEDSMPTRKHRPEPEKSHITTIAYPAYTRAYPTAHTIHEFVTTSDAIRDAKAGTLTVSEIQSLVDVLVWDDRLEKVGDGYRTVRGVDFRPMHNILPTIDGMDDEDGFHSNGLTQTPCGQCPVFDVCEEGGPVNPGNCVYFNEWLGLNDEQGNR
nr:putative dna-directed rna polymerase iii subunit rpc6 [Quercus suber]